MDNFLIKEYKNRHWQVAEIFKNGNKIATVNRFYEVDSNWIIIYDTVGGSGTGFNKGDVLQKIYIGDSTLNKEYLTD